MESSEITENDSEETEIIPSPISSISPKTTEKLTFSFGKCKICSDAATGIHYGNLNYLIDNEYLLYLSNLIKEYQLVKDVK